MTVDREFDRMLHEGARAVCRAGSCLPDTELAEFFAGRLSEERADAVRAHLPTCPTCLEAAREARRFVKTMRTAPPPGKVAGPRIRGYALVAAIAAIAIFAGVVHLLQHRARPLSPWAHLVVAPVPYDPGTDDLVWRSGSPSGTTDPLDGASARFRAEDYGGAADDLRAYVAEHPDDPRGRFYLGVARLLSGAPASAARDLEVASAMADAPADTEWYLALAYLESGHTVAARPVLKRVAASEGAHRTEARELLHALARDPAR